MSITIIDAANPVVLVRAETIGLKGTEIEEIDNSSAIRGTLEAIRCKAGVLAGLVATEQEATEKSQAVPKIAVISPGQPYVTTGGCSVAANEVDIVARIMSMGTLHQSYAVSGGISTVGGAMIPGTVAYDLLREESRHKKMLRIGHPGGIIDIGAVIEQDGKDYIYREAVVGRTARRLMEGHVLIEDRHFQPLP